MTTHPNPMSLPWSAEPPENGSIRVRILDCTGAAVGIVRGMATAKELIRAMHASARPWCCEGEVVWSNHFSAPVTFHVNGCDVPPPQTIRLLNGVLVSFNERLEEPALGPLIVMGTTDSSRSRAVPRDVPGAGLWPPRWGENQDGPDLPGHRE